MLNKLLVVLKLVERFPVIIQVGSAVLAFTAAKMVVSEPLLASVFGSAAQPHEMVQTAARWSTYIVAVVGVLVAGWWSSRKAATGDRSRHSAAGS